MHIRTVVIRAVVGIIGVPLVLVLIAVGGFYGSFYSLRRANGTIVSAGQEREYLLYVPPTRRALRNHPTLTRRRSTLPGSL